MKHRHRLATGTALATCLAAGAIQAQESATPDQPYALPAITLTANAEETELSRSGSSVSVIEAATLAAPARPVSAALQDLPGVSLRRSGPLGTTAAISVRGTPEEYVPVIFDGIDIGDPAAGQPAFDFGGLTGGGIGRIEVLRGTQSALYGSRAIGGVIDIQSLRPTRDGLHHSFALEAGSYDTLAASYGVTYRDDATDLAFSASRIKTDGFSARDENDGNFEADGHDATRLSFYAAHRLDAQTTIGLNGFWEDSTSNFDDFSGDVAGTPGNDKTSREAFGLRAFADFTTGPVDHRIALTRYRTDRLSSQDFAAPLYLPNVVVDDPFVGTRTKLAWQGATDLGGNGSRLIFGADTEKETAQGLGDARLSGAFAEITTPLGPDVDISASIRRDDHSRAGGFTSGRVSAVWRVQPDLLIRAAIGNGFRAPSLYELYGPYGDASITREKSMTAELGIEKQWGEDSYLRVTAFWLDAENLIGFDTSSTSCGQPFGCYNQVEGRSRRGGVELDGRFALSNGLTLSGAYTYTDNIDSTDWSDVSEHVLSLGAETRLATGTTAGISLHYEADRRLDLPSFTTVDLDLSHPLTAETTGYLRIENLLDREYQLVRGYGTSDRAIYVGIRADF
ncbi:TonB-dependent receptor [Paracoccus sp. M683]|uniref:TonB-dependent receptor plug domain-containing protein n=1 Tax=Paracoccus sp. M683 TaxID=2594268 RepID=UPI0011815FAB|nr:TonB-dependent receptor [Paracoccus sp. M683]TRW98382.1 TonB-dependent receptor [Paracoccus sp. M683]